MTVKTSSTTFVTAAATITAVGPTLEQTFASVAAGIQRLTDHPSYIATLPDPPLSEPEPAVCAFVKELDCELPLPEKLLRLALLVAQRFFDDARWTRRDVAGAAVFWVLPEPTRTTAYPGYEDRIADEFLARLGIESCSTRVIANGSGGFARAIEEAIKLFQSSAIQRALVVAADSWIDQHSMRWLDAAYRLKSERSPDGCIPGEACAMLALESPAAMTTGKPAPLARIPGAILAGESAPFGCGRRSTAAGLTQAIDGGGSLLPDAEPLWVLCDLNGESYRSAEWGAVLSRSRRLKNVAALWHAAENWGDAGAASGALAVALVAEAYRRGRAPASNALVWNASDGVDRGAVAVLPAE